MPRALELVCAQYPERMKSGEYFPYLAAAGTVSGLEYCIAKNYRIDPQSLFSPSPYRPFLPEFRDEAGWIDILVRNGLSLDTAIGERLLDSVIQGQHANALRSMLRLGLPRRFVDRFMLATSYPTAAYALPRIRLLLELGFDVEQPQVPGRKLELYSWADTRSPLGDAVLAGSPEVIELLLSHGADLETTACGQLKPVTILERIVCTEAERARLSAALQRHSRPPR
jgi:hypothetical protein